MGLWPLILHSKINDFRVSAFPRCSNSFLFWDWILIIFLFRFVSYQNQIRVCSTNPPTTKILLVDFLLFSVGIQTSHMNVNKRVTRVG